MAINSFTGINSFLSPLGLTRTVDKANSYQTTPPVVAPSVQPYKPISLADLYTQSHPEAFSHNMYDGMGDSWNAELGRRGAERNDIDFITSTDPERFKKNPLGPGLFDAFTSTDFGGGPPSVFAPLLQNPGSDLANARAFGVYHPLAHQQDPYVKYLNGKYRFTGNGWDLGDGVFYSPVKRDQGNQWQYNKTGNEEVDAPTFSQSLEKDWHNAFKDTGEFDPEGWYTNKPKSHALSGFLNTLAIIAPAFGGIFGAGADAAGLGATATENAIDAGALGGASTGASGAASMGAPGALGGGGIYGTGVSTGSSLANSAVENFAKNYLMSGGDFKKSALGTLKGGLAGLAGSGVSDLTDSGLAGRATQGALGAYLGGGDPMQGLLRGGVSGVITGGANALGGGSALNTVASKLGVSLNDVLFPKKKPRRA